MNLTAKAISSDFSRTPDQEEHIDISVQNLSKKFGNVTVLNDVSFEVQRGTSIALLGHNGSGKSTLLRCLVRLIDPEQGNVQLLGHNVTKIDGKDLRELRSRIGFIFQHHNLVKRASVLSNVLHGALSRSHNPRLWFQGTAPRKEREQAMQALDQVGLAEFASRRADQLSGGQSQRVAIARALMQRPHLIMADEPVASLDPQAGDDVMNLLFTLSQQNNITLLFSTHHLDHALSFSERIVVLKKGNLIRHAPTFEQNVKELRGLYE